MAEALRLCVIPGDGIGQEVVPAAVQVLRQVLPQVECVEAEAGWGCFQKVGKALPIQTIETATQCGAVLFGAVSSPARKVEGYRSPIVELRRRLDCYANLRPTVSPPLPGARPGVNLLVIRENTEDIYIGEEESDGEVATAMRRITRLASRRVGEVACRLSRGKLTIVHKANILPLTDGLFRDSVREVAEAQFPRLELEERLVDAAAYELARYPERFDTLVAPNLYGDILSDLAAAWGGGLGMAPSLNLGESAAIAEPVHGSAPDIAGKGQANPVAAMLSLALLARSWWNQPHAADAIEQAVAATLAAGMGTADLNLPTRCSTQAFTYAVLARLA